MVPSRSCSRLSRVGSVSFYIESKYRRAAVLSSHHPSVAVWDGVMNVTNWCDEVREAAASSGAGGGVVTFWCEGGAMALGRPWCLYFAALDGG